MTKKHVTAFVQLNLEREVPRMVRSERSCISWKEKRRCGKTREQMVQQRKVRKMERQGFASERFRTTFCYGNWWKTLSLHLVNPVWLGHSEKLCWTPINKEQQGSTNTFPMQRIQRTLEKKEETDQRGSWKRGGSLGKNRFDLKIRISGTWLFNWTQQELMFSHQLDVSSKPRATLTQNTWSRH